MELEGRYFFEVLKGKTKNAQRIIPVSPVIEPILLEALEIASEEGPRFLFPEVAEPEVEGMTPEKAMNSISSRISSIMTSFEKEEGFKVGLHSLRGHFATALEEVGCPEDTAALLAGHKRLSLTYGLYSKYNYKDKLWTYIDKIHTSKALEPWEEWV